MAPDLDPGNPSGFRWSNGKGSPWSTMEPQLHRDVQPEHARAFRSGAVSRETLPRYYALQLLPKMVDVIAGRSAGFLYPPVLDVAGLTRR